MITHNQKALEEAIEEMGVWVTKHPTGTLTVVQGGERFTIFPHPARWTYHITAGNRAYPYRTGFFTRKDVQKMVHKVQLWAWQNGAKHGIH